MKLLEDAIKIKALAERLTQCPEVTKWDKNQEREAWTLAHSFSDLEESCKKFLEEHLPKLVRSQLSPSEVYDVLLEIGEELRHILYHIRDPKFYRYLSDEETREKVPGSKGTGNV